MSKRSVKCVASVNTGAVGAKLKLGYTHTHVAYCNRKNTEIGDRHPGGSESELIHTAEKQQA